MKVVFRKKFIIWLKCCPEILCGFILLYFINLNNDSSGLSPRFEAALPYATIIISGIFVLGIFYLFRWVVKPKKLVLDLSTKELSLGSEVFNFNNHVLVISTRSYSNERFYYLSFRDAEKITKFEMPEGYIADTSYRVLVSNLEGLSIPFYIVHKPWLFEQSQKEEDRRRNSFKDC
ncbi:hypothetical protein AAY72_06185 [Alishewanella sp. WH16-1]|uniref:hypothetical protein n=1 Tax=Alishewanella sp. WH16-1 TaxID=1651088 RepID=UPI00070D9B77|nr:hypothetical protein [Alishewanella sp. WH16-1]KRS21900.1 hypothetical protein AAY72_06185 [Alishewanella sp. WH16-1]